VKLGSGLGVFVVNSVLLASAELDRPVLTGSEQLPQVATTADGSLVVDAGGSLPFVAEQANGVIVQVYARQQVLVHMNASAAEIETALLSLSGVQSVSVDKYGPDSEGGSDWHIALTSILGPLPASCSSDPRGAAPCLIVSPTDVSTGSDVADNAMNVYVLVNTTVPGSPTNWATDLFGEHAGGSVVSVLVPASSAGLPVNEVQVVRIRALGSDSVGYGTPAPDTSEANEAGFTSAVGLGISTNAALATSAVQGAFHLTL